MDVVLRTYNMLSRKSNGQRLLCRTPPSSPHHVGASSHRTHFAVLVGDGTCLMLLHAYEVHELLSQVEDKFSPFAKETLAKLIKFQTVSLQLLLVNGKTDPVFRKKFGRLCA